MIKTLAAAHLVEENVFLPFAVQLHYLLLFHLISYQYRISIAYKIGKATNYFLLFSLCSIFTFYTTTKIT